MNWTCDTEYTVRVLNDGRGRLLRELWLQNGVPSRINGPSHTSFDPDTGHIITQLWERDGQLSRLEVQGGEIDGGPAVIHYDRVTGKKTREEYWIHGTLNRFADKPAVIHYDGRTGRIKLSEYYLEGVRHRDSGPAYVRYSLKTGHPLEEVYIDRGRIGRDDGDPVIRRHWRTGEIVATGRLPSNPYLEQLVSPT